MNSQGISLELIRFFGTILSEPLHARLPITLSVSSMRQRPPTSMIATDSFMEFF